MPYPRLPYWWYVISHLDFSSKSVCNREIIRFRQIDIWLPVLLFEVIFVNWILHLIWLYENENCKAIFSFESSFDCNRTFLPVMYSKLFPPIQNAFISHCCMDRTFLIRTYPYLYLWNDVRKWLNDTTLQQNNTKSMCPLQITIKLRLIDDGNRWHPYPIKLTYDSKDIYL